ncbi:MAG: hypothetical protein JXR46_09165 [Calditrichaceae bacterium]|nr:hypothetical protein [Calditrichaceae bacterium]MBN2709202.1 hypothetical protein [Calditrichaceae bacterium]RQV96157.1 MAG: hypothetical protein EH224_05475 [Calditrichota bacterium]
MKKLCLLFLLFTIGIIQAQQPYGSYHLIHTQTAKSFEKGRLEFFSNMNFYTKNIQFLGTGPTPDVTGYNLWAVAGNVAFTYGFTKYFDATVGLRVYQDVHRGEDEEANIPDDVFLMLKAASFNLAKNRLLGGFNLKMRFPTGEYYNYQNAEYASGAVEYGLGGMLSFYADPYIPEKSFSAHLNIGWYNHNDTGIEHRRNIKIAENTSELNFALGLMYPTSMFDFMLDVSGISYLSDLESRENAGIRSRENWMFVTPGMKYKPFNWLTFVMGVDVLISKKVEFGGDYDIPMYPPWKAQLGMNIKILPFVPSRKTAAELERDEFNKRIEFFQKIVEERERSEDVREELERLKREREEAEKELEELKQILEEEGK